LTQQNGLLIAMTLTPTTPATPELLVSTKLVYKIEMKFNKTQTFQHQYHVPQNSVARLHLPKKKIA